MSGYPQPPYGFDQSRADNSVENSSYTAILADGSIAGGTPGINQIPAPGALAPLAVGALGTMRRRR